MLSRTPRGRVEVVVHTSLEPEWSGQQEQRVEGGPSAEEQSRLARARVWLAQRVEHAGLRGAAINVGAGDPRHEILAVQRRHAIELVVVGGRGSGDATAPVLGSVADAVMESVSCSVLVV
jgi:nucleotide-binding universal stress UspA family protein